MVGGLLRCATGFRSWPPERASNPSGRAVTPVALQHPHRPFSHSLSFQVTEQPGFVREEPLLIPQSPDFHFILLLHSAWKRAWL